MSIGTLRLRVVLDAPNKNYSGSRDPITGQVVLFFDPSRKFISESNGELFGPLRLSVTLHGRAKTKVWKSNGNSTTIHRGRLPLFSSETIIYSDAFRSQPHETHNFPFEIFFPENVEPGSYGGWTPEAPFFPQDEPPSSFAEEYRGFSNHYEWFVEYRLKTDAVMEGLKVAVHTPDKEFEPRLSYERQRLSSPLQAPPAECNGSVSISNEFLLPENDRPAGFKQKMKAAFSSDYYPTYAFDWTCTAPRVVHLGQPVSCRVSITPNESQCTATAIPEVFLSGFIVEINGNTAVRAEKLIVGTPHARGSCTPAIARGMIDDRGPFSKGNDWTKTINVGAFQSVPPTFSTLNISRTYTMTVKLVFSLAGKQKDFDRTFDLLIQPSLHSAEAEPGPSASQAVGGTAATSAQPFDMNDTLPEYQRPPEYETDLKS